MNHTQICVLAALTPFVVLASGCVGDRCVVAADAIRRYEVAQGDDLDRAAARRAEGRLREGFHRSRAVAPASSRFVADEPFVLLSMPTFVQDSQPASAPAGRASSEPPPGYWRPNVWRQMGGEFKDFGTRGLWHGFKTSFWDAENLLVLTGTLGASIAIRESGVDDAIRRRTHGQFEMRDFDEPVQILGNPNLHFGLAGALWLGSTISKDLETHEFAKTLGEALCVNGLTTLALKFSTNTRAPDTDNRAWPSGHFSSAVTVAAVVNEYYGPWAGVPAIALAGLVGYQRLDSRVHDFSDVVFGGMLGWVVGTSIARDEKAKFPELFGMKVVPFNDPETGAAGLALWKSW